MNKTVVWDEVKRRANIAKHGLDFADLTIGFFATAISIDAGDGRRKAVGRFADGTIVVVYVELGTQGIGVISMRRASRKERRLIDA